MKVGFSLTPGTQLTPGGNFLFTKIYAAFKLQGGFEAVKKRQISVPSRGWTRFTK